MLESLKNIFSVADLRKRVLFTLGLLAVYRVGGHIPTPGINPEALAVLVDQAKNTASASGLIPGVGMWPPTRYTASRP
ncbi:MAG TPA: hypothetical protein VK595_06595, partial [Vicinamibacterales bacterium]|nr:hypothetical protein [Vicinamibacterales bacterium]